MCHPDPGICIVVPRCQLVVLPWHDKVIGHIFNIITINVVNWLKAYKTVLASMHGLAAPGPHDSGEPRWISIEHHCPFIWPPSGVYGIANIKYRLNVAGVVSLMMGTASALRPCYDEESRGLVQLVEVVLTLKVATYDASKGHMGSAEDVSSHRAVCVSLGSGKKLVLFMRVHQPPQDPPSTRITFVPGTSY